MVVLTQLLLLKLNSLSMVIVKVQHWYLVMCAHFNRPVFKKFLLSHVQLLLISSTSVKCLAYNYTGGMTEISGGKFFMAISGSV